MQPSARFGVAAGAVAGVIALGCCVGPAVGGLLGVASATAMFELANDLYGTWGWAFKLAGVAFASAAAAAAFRGVRRCEVASRSRRVARFLAGLVVTGLATYGVLYGATTWLGDAAVAAPPRVRARGATPHERMVSALTQVRRHYPEFRVEVEGLSSTGVRLLVGWRNPDVDPLSDAYAREVSRRVEDSREATLVLLRALAASDPEMQSFSAYEDGFFVPVWSRTQILSIDDPRVYRDFARYSEFVHSAEKRSGYASLREGGW